MEVAKFDVDGFLVTGDWTEDMASEIASELNITLTPQHWQVITAVRKYFEQSSRSPSMRPLVKLIRTQCGSSLGNSIALTKLFPSPTSGTVSKICGLPKPSDCI